MFLGLRKKNHEQRIDELSFENPSRQVIPALRFHIKT